MSLDAEQREYLRSLLLREQEMIRSTLRMDLFGRGKEEVLHKAELIDRTLSTLEV